MKLTPEQKIINHAIDRSTTSADTLPSATKKSFGMKAGEKYKDFSKRTEEINLVNLPILNRNNKKRPSPIIREGKNTYLSNPEVRKNLDLWEVFLDKAKNSKTREDRIEARDTRRMIMRDYNNKERRRNIGDDELMLIGKHKSQLNRPVVTPVITPLIKTQIKEFIPRQPEKTLEEYLRFRSVVKPGLSEDLINFRKEVNKNLDYVIGKDEYQKNMKDQKVELEDPTQGDNND
jgi:hypothetical protein